MTLTFLSLFIVSFFLGAVPFGLVLSRLIAGMDVRKQGSGNIGATNVARTLGLKFGVLTLLLDLAKGFAPALTAVFIFNQAELSERFMTAAVGLAPVLGHVYSPFLKFKGGKGMATALGVYLALVPLALIPSLLVFVAVTARWGYVSAGSLSAAAAMPPAALVIGYPPVFVGMTVMLAALIFLRHRENIARLRRGEENKWRKKNSSPPPDPPGSPLAKKQL